MEQIVRVREVFDDGSAMVVHVRESACSGDCHKCSGCGAAQQTVVFAGSKVRMVLEAAGIHNIRAKCLRSNNPINVVKATLAGLSELRTVEEVARIRDITAEDVKGGTQK